MNADLTPEMRAVLTEWISELRRVRSDRPPGAAALDQYDAALLEDELGGVVRFSESLRDLRDSLAVSVCRALAASIPGHVQRKRAQRVVALDVLLRRAP